MLTQAQRDFIVSIIDGAADLTIATLRADGWPQATTVSFASDGLAVYFGTNGKSQKAQNINRDDRVSATIVLILRIGVRSAAFLSAGARDVCWMTKSLRKSAR